VGQKPSWAWQSQPAQGRKRRGRSKLGLGQLGWSVAITGRGKEGLRLTLAFLLGGQVLDGSQRQGRQHAVLCAPVRGCG
jgi:hypothetical protein